MPLFTGFLNTSQVKLFGFSSIKSILLVHSTKVLWISTYEVGSCSRVFVASGRSRNVRYCFSTTKKQEKIWLWHGLFMFMYYIYLQYTYMITVLYFYKSIYISTFVGKVRVNENIFPETNSKSSWKSVVGRWVSLCHVSFLEGTHSI